MVRTFGGVIRGVSMEGSVGMKLPITARLGLLAATVVLLSACGTSDEPQAAPTTVSTSASSAQPPGSSSSNGTSPGTGRPSSDPASAEDPSGAAAASSAVEGSPASEAAPTTTTQTPAVPPPVASVPAPQASGGIPTTYPDPKVVEKIGHATNPLCEAVTVDEMADLLGAAVRPAIDDAEGTGCLWLGVGDDSRFAQMQMIGDPARYLRPAGADDVSGIGDAAFVVAAEGGWTAQAHNPDGTFAVRLVAPGATKDATVEGLRRLLERY